MASKVVQVFNTGINDCEHNYVYSNEAKFIFTYPPTYGSERICEKCGRYEYVQSQELIAVEDEKEFADLINKFNLKK